MLPKNARIPVYDIIRLFTAALVVLGHSTYLTITTDHGGINYTFETAKGIFSSGFFKTWLYWSAWIYRFHIPLFFMLAGSVFALRPKTVLCLTTALIILNIADTKNHFLPPLFFMTAGALLIYFIALSCCVLLPEKSAASVVQKAADQTITVYPFHDPLMFVILAFFPHTLLFCKQHTAVYTSAAEQLA